MKKGHRRPDLPSTKVARGTYQPHRDDAKIEVIEPDSLPIQPDWLTPAGQQVWLDDIGRVSPERLTTERDSTMFAQYCNLQGALIESWRSDAVPPASHLMEARKMAEQFGIFGRKSRMIVDRDAAGKSSNPFSRNGRRPAE